MISFRYKTRIEKKKMGGDGETGPSGEKVGTSPKPGVYPSRSTPGITHINSIHFVDRRIHHVSKRR